MYLTLFVHVLCTVYFFAALKFPFFTVEKSEGKMEEYLTLYHTISK
jgi:hypothetical protein